MIIFYNKKTGEIEGTIDGRIHPESHLNMWVGEKNDTDRLVIQWEFIEAETEEGGTGAGIYEPQHPQKDLIIDLENKVKKLNDFKIDLETKLLTSK